VRRADALIRLAEGAIDEWRPPPAWEERGMDLLALGGRDAATPGKTLAADVFSWLREDLLAVRFQPGDKLPLNELRDRYSVGFSPLREALMHLAADGLVVVEQQKGFRVAPISIDDLWDVTRSRQLIEETLLREAVQNGDHAWEGEIVSAFHKLEKLASTDPATGLIDPEWARRHYAFHYALINSSPSRCLKRFWQSAYDQSDRYRRISASVIGNRDEEHFELMQAALAKDAATLLTINRQHIQKTAEFVADWFSRPPAASPPSARGRRRTGLKSSA
jgi:GntR family carbon starvation induced transcriptional regulator